MAFNIGNIFEDITKWIGIGQTYVDRGQDAVTAAQPVLGTVVDAIDQLTGIGKDLLTKPDPTPEHIAKVDALRKALVEQANALRTR